MPKSIIAQRREQGAICARCKAPDYITRHPNRDMGQTKPYFTCTQCKHEWCYGKSGGIFYKLRLKMGEMDVE